MAEGVIGTMTSMLRALAWLLLTCALGGLAGCADPTEDARAITIKNDLPQTIVLRICDFTGCDNLNDRVRPGADIAENVSISDNPYRFQVVDLAHRQLGCLEVTTRPLPSGAVAVSSVREGTGKCR